MRKRGRPARYAKKPLQFNIRMSRELRAELNESARLGGRPISYQIEHMITIARMTIQTLCDGSDNLAVVEERLKKAGEIVGSENG
jgi:predicted DNA-binding protein